MKGLYSPITFMNVLDKLRKYWSVPEPHEVVAKGFTPDNRSRLTTSNLPTYPIWFYSPLRGIPRTGNNIETRQFARSSWVQMVHFAIKKAVTQTPWDIVVDSSDPEINEDDFKEDILFARTFLENPNRELRQNFDDLIWPMLTDLLEINTAVWYLNGNVKDRLLEIISYDGSTFLIEQEESGFLEKYWQFTYKNPILAPRPFEPEHIVFFQMNKQTYDPYGISPLHVVETIVELLDQSTRFNKDFFLNDAIPAIILNAIGAGVEGLQAIEDSWNEQLRGENARIITIDAPDLKVEKIQMSNRDMEWLDGNKLYMHVVFAAHGLSPTEVGFTDTTGSKNVQEGQQQITIKNAHKPYLHLIEKEINNMVLPWILGEMDVLPHERKPLKFKYFIQDPAMESAEQEGQRKDVDTKILSINEVRKERGMEPFPSPAANDPFFIDPALQAGLEAASNPGDDNDGNVQEDDSKRKRYGATRKPKKEKEEDEETDKNALTTEDIDVDRRHLLISEPLTTRKPGDKNWLLLTEQIKAATPVPIEAGQDYATFMDKMLSEWERQVIKGINSRLFKNIEKEAFMKGFNDFMSVVVGRVTTTPFLNVLKTVVRNTMGLGVDEAEEELDMNVAMGLSFRAKVDAETNKQFDGYTLVDGSRWIGLKGVSQQLQNKILMTVDKGLTEGKFAGEIVQDVQDVFEGVKKSRAQAIVRTESTRIVNEGKLLTYLESGVPGRKQWIAFNDARTSDTCEFMDNQVVLLSEKFVDDEGKEFQTPPSHVNCRSTIRFLPGLDGGS